jgi:hypothetical protein
MLNEIAPTTDELKAAWQRAMLWRAGVSFSEAMSRPLVRWALEKSALARRRSRNLPAQPALF